MPDYEALLDADMRSALEEASMHFEEKSAVHAALGEVTRRLNELRIPYALVGGMALFIHGYRRFTEDVDLLVTQEGLERIRERLVGLGYVPIFEGIRGLRDREHGVRIEFRVTGEYPGDGKPKPVAFPDPLESSTLIGDIRLISLPKLMELKLASGMTSPGRLRDLADVQDLIKALKLPVDFAKSLNPYVQEEFTRLWRGVQGETQ